MSPTILKLVPLCFFYTINSKLIPSSLPLPFHLNQRVSDLSKMAQYLKQHFFDYTISNDHKWTIIFNQISFRNERFYSFYAHKLPWIGSMFRSTYFEELINQLLDRDFKKQLFSLKQSNPNKLLDGFIS